jgi:hypothetical protein
MPVLTIRLKRHADEAVSLTCTRRDGSVTWQRLESATAMVMPSHDLTHFAVEATLGVRRGFYGLLAEGWAIQDFAKPWPRGPIPDEAREVELIVGCLDAERREGVTWSEAEFAHHAALFIEAAEARGKAVPDGVRLPTAAELVQVRAVRDGLLARWVAVEAGGELVLEFGAGD